jgi:hypothetical protein
MIYTKYGHPRRIDLNAMSPTELSILKVVGEVELLGADTKLTDAVVLLQQARDKVADYVDMMIARKAVADYADKMIETQGENENE